MSEIDTVILWRRFKGSSDRAAKEELVNRYLHLVKYIAGRLKVNFPPQVEYDDLMSSGIIGLLDAIEKFDPERGLKFETYAMSRIRGAIIDELRHLDWAPRSVRKKGHDLEETYRKLERELGRTATDSEVADAMNIDTSELHRLMGQLSSAVFMSLDDFVAIGKESDTVRRINTVEDDVRTHADELLHGKQVQKILGKAIDGLPEKVRLMISLYYFEDLNLKEIGEVLGVSESRVCQIHTQAMLQLRSKLDDLKHDLLNSYA